MPTLICSGVNRPDVLALLARERVAGMVNATVACQPALVEAYERYSEVPLYLDSGAFQGKQDSPLLHHQRQGRGLLGELQVLRPVRRLPDRFTSLRVHRT